MAEDFTPPEIKEKLGILSTTKGGWTTELNFISWNGRAPKYDIRSWDPNHEKMGKGITFTKDELSALKKLLNTMEEI